MVVQSLGRTAAATDGARNSARTLLPYLPFLLYQMNLVGKAKKKKKKSAPNREWAIKIRYSTQISPGLQVTGSLELVHTYRDFLQINGFQYWLSHRYCVTEQFKWNLGFRVIGVGELIPNYWVSPAPLLIKGGQTKDKSIHLLCPRLLYLRK